MDERLIRYHAELVKRYEHDKEIFPGRERTKTLYLALELLNAEFPNLPMPEAENELE